MSNPAEPLPIPDPIWHRLVEFLQSGRSGQFRLNIAKGQVVGAEVIDQIRVPHGSERA